MAEAADLGLLCHKHGGGRLCYKHGGNALIYKAKAGEETTVTFAWGSDARDLDILAYWEGAPQLTAGYGHGSGGTEKPYSLVYSGDITSSDASEWCKVKMSPWGGGGSRRFFVHFNFFGFGEDYPGAACTVVASQPDGKTLIKRDQSCATDAGRAAAQGDPCCILTFDEAGKLVSIE